MGKAMVFSCLYCRTGTPPDVTVCNRPLCKRKEAQHQTELKCKELGIGMTQLQLFRIFRPQTSP